MRDMRCFLALVGKGMDEIYGNRVRLKNWLL
jgi:hypothetical protein